MRTSATCIILALVLAAGLAAAAETPLVKVHSQPSWTIRSKEVELSVTQLGGHMARESNDFSVRQKATEELERLGDLAVATLEKALAVKPSLETRTRIDRLLEKSDRTPPPEVLRSLRALEALEHAGTPEARQLLKALAKGADGARLTREAQAALQRLTKTGKKLEE